MHEISADRVMGVNNVVPYDVFICDLAEGVQILPSGEGAQLLTWIIQRALANSNNSLRLSEVRIYSKRFAITVQAVDVMGTNVAAEDMAALARHKIAAAQYYKSNVS